MESKNLTDKVFDSYYVKLSDILKRNTSLTDYDKFSISIYEIHSKEYYSRYPLFGEMIFYNDYKNIYNDIRRSVIINTEVVCFYVENVFIDNNIIYGKIRPTNNLYGELLDKILKNVTDYNDYYFSTRAIKNLESNRINIITYDFNITDKLDANEVFLIKY